MCVGGVGGEGANFCAMILETLYFFLTKWSSTTVEQVMVEMIPRYS